MTNGPDGIVDFKDKIILDKMNDSVKSIKIKKIRKPKVKKRTLEEFKSWLDGLSQFQDDEWSPNYEQWTHIKDSIAVIIEPVSIQSEIQTFQQTISEPVYEGIPRTNPVLNATSALDTGSVSRPPIVQNNTSLTSDIDTSDGQYTSDFE